MLNKFGRIFVKKYVKMNESMAGCFQSPENYLLRVYQPDSVSCASF